MTLRRIINDGCCWLAGAVALVAGVFVLLSRRQQPFTLFQKHPFAVARINPVVLPVNAVQAAGFHRLIFP
jgi:hypothetical protein